jgi:hypothetical protein
LWKRKPPNFQEFKNWRKFWKRLQFQSNINASI